MKTIDKAAFAQQDAFGIGDPNEAYRYIPSGGFAVRQVW